MARKKKGGHGGGHGWFVTFADLMGLLMSFFVVVAAFSTMDQAKMMALLGSMRDAFGTTLDPKLTGMIEPDGLPVRPKVGETTLIPDPGVPRSQRGTPGDTATSAQDARIAAAAATLRQALADLPEIAELSRQIMVEETPQGIEILLVDQDGRSMFPEGSREPYERTRRILTGLAPKLRALPNRIIIEGHTASTRNDPNESFRAWDLSSERANRVRAVLMEAGIPGDRFHTVAGRADTEPLFPDNPQLAANRRMVIRLMREAATLPPGYRL